jgi:hypothetical protein
MAGGGPAETTVGGDSGSMQVREPESAPKIGKYWYVIVLVMGVADVSFSFPASAAAPTTELSMAMAWLPTVEPARANELPTLVAGHSVVREIFAHPIDQKASAPAMTAKQIVLFMVSPLS